MRDRARFAFNMMAPDRRSKLRGLSEWVDYTAERLAFEACAQAAVIALQVAYKAMKAAVAVWVAMVSSRHTRERKVALCLARTSPEKRDSLLGFESLCCRAPSWERGAHYTHISKKGFGVTHQRDRQRDAVVGSPRLHHGDLYTFAFAVVGGGAGVVIGVADAGYVTAESPEQLGGAWGINLSHGALFSKKSFVDRGELHAQQILPIASVDRTLPPALEASPSLRGLALRAPGLAQGWPRAGPALYLALEPLQTCDMPACDPRPCANRLPRIPS